MSSSLQVQNDMKNLLASLPDGLKVEFDISNGSAIWKITQKPVGFLMKDEKALLKQLNSLANNINFEQ